MQNYQIHDVVGASDHCGVLIKTLKEAKLYPPAFNPEGEGDQWLANYLR